MNTRTPSKRSGASLERLLHTYANQSKTLLKPVAASSMVLPLGAAFLAGISPAEGAIVYTNPPDITLNATFPVQNIDVNGAWGNDIRFSFTSFGHLNVNDGSYTGNGFNVDGFNGDTSFAGAYVLPFARNNGFPFNAGAMWNEVAGSRNVMADGQPFGGVSAHWDALSSGATRYLGVRGMMGSNTHYAWVRVTFYDVDHIVIHDWAYESIPGQGIDAGEGIPLPVELVAFNAQLKAGSTHLTWRTASEQNNAGFDLQRSEDGTSFLSLAWVEGRGNTAEQQDYFYDDKNLREGKTYYYRLRQVDYDGQFDFSPVVTVTVGGKGAAAGEFYPNPAPAGKVTLDFTAKEDGEWKVTVFDAAGKLANFQNLPDFSAAEGSNALAFDFSGLPGGVYFVKMEHGTERVYRKLVVE